MDKVHDRRSQKTRTALLVAFHELLLARGYDALQVGDVCTRADVGRSTFYEHFRSRGELLRASLATPLADMADMVLPAAVAQDIVPRLHHFREHQQVVRVLLGAPTRAIVSQALTMLIAARLHDAWPGKFTCSPEIVARLVADAQLALLDIWVAGRPACTVDDAADVLQRTGAALVGAFAP